MAEGAGSVGAGTEQSVNITVRTLTGKAIPLVVPLSITIDELRTRMREVYPISCHTSVLTGTPVAEGLRRRRSHSSFCPSRKDCARQTYFGADWGSRWRHLALRNHGLLWRLRRALAALRWRAHYVQGCHEAAAEGDPKRTEGVRRELHLGS